MVALLAWILARVVAFRAGGGYIGLIRVVDERGGAPTSPVRHSVRRGPDPDPVLYPRVHESGRMRSTGPVATVPPAAIAYTRPDQ